MRTDILSPSLPPSLPKVTLVSEPGRTLYKNYPVSRSPTVTMPTGVLETSVKGFCWGSFFRTSNTGSPEGNLLLAEKIFDVHMVKSG